jgi:hypothetical protein
MFNTDNAARRGQGHGYNRVLLDGAVIEEHDTFQCCHCNDTVFIAKDAASPWCSCCNKQWCGRPRCRECVPFMRMVERQEAMCRQRLLLWREADNV